MKRFGLYNILFLLGIIFLTVSSGIAQGNPPPPGNQFGEGDRRQPGLLELLGLTKDQVRQIRQLNQTLQPMRKEAQQRLAMANKALDEAIYADETNDEIINQRLKDVQFAQGELIKSKIMMETSVRKLLTREQLFKFRQLRERAKQNQPNPDNPPPNKPFQKRRIGQPNRPAI